MNIHFTSCANLFLRFLCLILLSNVLCAQTQIMADRGIKMDLINGRVIQKHLYTMEDGLASNDVFCGLHDKNGFIWIGTRNGLNRFDGKKFKTFTIQNGLAYNAVIFIHQADSQHLILTYQIIKPNSNHLNVEIFDLQKEKIVPFEELYPDLPFPKDEINYIFQEGDQLLFFVSNHQLWSLTNGHFQLKIDFSKKIQTAILQKIKNPFVFFKNDCMLMYDQKPNHPIILSIQDSIYVIPKKYNQAYIGFDFFIDDERNLFCTTKNVQGFPTTRKLNLKGDTIPEPFFTKSISRKKLIHILPNVAFTEDWKYVVEFQEKDSLYYYHQGWNRISYFLKGGQYRLNLSLNQLFFNYFLDKNNQMWLCTSLGLIKISSYQNKFQHYFTKTIGDSELNNQARGIFVDSIGNVYGNIWNKIMKKDIQGKTSSIYTHSIMYPLLKKNDHILALGDKLFISNQKQNQKLEEINAPALAWSMLALNDSSLLLGSLPFQVFNLKTKKSSPIAFSNFPINLLCYRMILGKENDIWAVCQNGIYQIQDLKVVQYFGNLSKNKKHQIPCQEILDLLIDSDGIFWIATNGQGLLKWDRKKEKFSNYTIQNGFPSNILVRIEQDDSGNLWISTENGLCRFNKITGAIHTFTTKEGLSHHEFNRISSTKGKNGFLYFGGLNGIIGFNPKDFLNEQTQNHFPLQVTQFSQFDGNSGKILDKTLDLLIDKQIILNPNDRFCEITVQMLNFEEGENHYAYKIEGIDQEWHYLPDNNIRLSGLPYGSYQLKIKAQNHWGVWNNNQLHFPLLIIKPFYLRTWFIVSALFSISLLIFTFIRWRTNRLEAEKLKLENTVKLRTSELQKSLQERELLLKELHHRIKNNFSLILSFIYYQNSMTEDIEISNQLSALYQRIHSISSANDLILMNYDQDFTQDSLYIDEYLKCLTDAILGLDQKTFKLIYDVEHHLLNTDTCIPMGMLLNELLTNTIKYAQPSPEQILKISIYLKIEENIIHFHYSDNGIVYTDGKKSLGMTIIQSMVRQLKGEMKKDGACYEFSLQIKN